MKKRMYAWILSFLCLFLLLENSMEAKAEVIHETDLEDYILREMSEAHVMSMGISIVSPEREVYCASYGAETRTDRDYTLGELTQSFTAAAIMHLSEDSEISLDDTVGHYLSDTKYENVKDVRIRELLTQTSGISLYETMSEITRSGTQGKFEAAPVNYNILGEIIETVSGVSYEEYVADNILDPLKMESTHSLRNNSEFSDEMIQGYHYYFGFPFEVGNSYDETDEWIQVSSGLMVSDVKDMGSYLQMYLQNGGDVLSDSSIGSMLDGKNRVDLSSQNGNPVFDSEAFYGMGWLSTKVNGKQVYYYTGRSNNSTTAMFLLPEQKLGIAILFNTVDYNGQGLLEKLESGIVAIELENQAEQFKSENYLRDHILIDIGLVLIVFATWMPIFMIGVWGNRRRRKLFNIPGILIDVCIHLVLPTGILYWVQEQIPLFFFRRLYPDSFYIFAIVTGSLYLGAVIKIIAMIVFAILGPKKIDDEEDSIGDSIEDKESDSSEETKKEDEKNEPESKEEEKKETKPKDEEKKAVKPKEEKKADSVVKNAPVKKVQPSETTVKKTEVKKMEAKNAPVKEAGKEKAEVKKVDAKEVKTQEKPVTKEAQEKEENGSGKKKSRRNRNNKKKNG